jgi:peptidoglycan/LPS O-acetylase OafA/YrhL
VTNEKPTMKIRTFEAARGLLALWVVVGHTIKHVGYGPEQIGPWKLLASPGLAVDCFIMLSGFVIFLLLDTQRISYRHYITRRFLRIAPLYAVVVAVSAWTLGWQIDVIQAQRWPGHAISNDLAIHRDSLQFLAKQLVAHATMLHGLLPSSLLPNSQYAIVGQAWSISVEWQFYLIAPAIFFLVMSKRWRMLGALLLMVCALHSLNLAGEGFVIKQAGFFCIGILSYYLWKHSDAIRPEHFPLVDLFAVVAIALVYFISNRGISLFIWIVMLGAAIAEKREMQGNLLSLAAGLACKPSFQWLGRISYSLYMVHMLVIYFWLYWLGFLLPPVSKAAFLGAQLPLVVSSAIVVSAFSYRLIELPAMRLGSRLGVPAKPAKGPAHSYQNPA